MTTYFLNKKITTSIMNKGMITKAFKIFLEAQKRSVGRPCKVGYWRILRAILYKLRTGVQWKHLPMKQLFGKHSYSWSSAYYHFNKWSKSNAFVDLLRSVLSGHKREIDLSIANIDGTHTISKKGGQAVGYQRRKKAKTSNSIIISDRNGQPLFCSEPISGNHHDLFKIEKSVSKILNFIRSCDIPTKGLFLNADAGFDGAKLKRLCEREEITLNVDRNKRNSSKAPDDDYFIDNKLYNNRFVIEQSNAWMDAFKGLMLRYETSSQNWYSFQLLAFAAFFLRRIEKLTFSF